MKSFVAPTNEDEYVRNLSSAQEDSGAGAGLGRSKFRAGSSDQAWYTRNTPTTANIPNPLLHQ
jgi:hypothetical protein